MALELVVHGKQVEITSPTDTPLLYVLRNDLGLKGPKFGCGLELCAACAVLVGNKETRPCIPPASQFEGKRITTLEGLPGLWVKAKNRAHVNLHPVQQAWIDEQVPQCGYCQNGMIMMAVDLLSRHSNPSVTQIEGAFSNTPPSPHLCRCGTYDSVVKAVQRASPPPSAHDRGQPHPIHQPRTP